MATPQAQIVMEPRPGKGPGNDTAEVKQREQNYVVDESLSEWELARMTSKTWSMEQE